MRQIKFRVWDTKEECWSSGFSIHSNGSYTEKTVNQFIADPQNYWSSVPEHIKIMQFTGLLDKNGKEIYEGDILRAHRFIKGYRNRLPRTEELIFEVKWLEKFKALGIYYKKMKWEAFLGFDDPYEVIGDIYSTPELLK